MRRTYPSPRIIALAILVLLAASTHAEETTFDPVAHLPGDLLLFAHARSVSGFLDSLEQTLAGKIVSHASTQRATEGLRRLMAPYLGVGEAPAEGSEQEKWLAMFQGVTGMRPHELLELLGSLGEVSVAARGPGPTGIPEVAVSLEVPAERSAQFDNLLSRLTQLLAQQTGSSVETRQVGGLEAAVVQLPFGPVFRTRFGNHTVVVSSPGLFRSIADAYQGSAEPGSSHRDSRLAQAAAKALPLADPEVTLLLDAQQLRRIGLALADAQGGAQELEHVLKLTGLDGVDSIAWAAGVSDGALDLVAHLGLSGESRGLLGAIEGSLGKLENLDGALSQVPAGAFEVQAWRWNPGRFLRDTLTVLEEGVPEMAAMIDEVLPQLEQASGLSLTDDLLTLQDATVVSFAVTPPAGGLFGDRIALLRKNVLAGYLNLLRKIGKRVGANEKTIDLAEAKISYLTLSSGLQVDGEFFKGILNGQPPRDPLPLVASLIPTVAWVEMEDDWVAVSSSTQALHRYVRFYRKSKSFADSGGAVGPLFAAQADGATSLAVYRPDGFLWLYNSAISVLSAFSGVLEPVGIEVALLAPGEEFRTALRPGLLRFSKNSHGLTLEGRGLLSSPPVVWIVAGTALGAGVVLPIAAVGSAENVEAEVLRSLPAGPGDGGSGRRGGRRGSNE